ncbi:MAG: PEP-CTERM sorting domain-containing protein [Planctomycetota bacterium]|nr:MAG: PEP-CTERM sorting domain-containing protein [Planctomycetota bacterium]REK44384.1 MAG: PEP-CTERM sorting domain-containing protein [Planctomycetota bacterium]
MYGFRLGLACCIVLLAASSARAMLVKNISTGIDDGTLTKIGNDVLDPDFVVAAGSIALVGEVPIARSSPLPPPYQGDAASLDSRWIMVDTGIGEQGINAPAGTYYFDTTVDMSGYDPATAEIMGFRFAADNKMQRVFINDAIAYTRPVSFGSDFSLRNVGDIGLGLFRGGANTIRFEVLNDGTVPTALALRLEGTVQASLVPEPSTCALLWLGMLGLGLFAWRRRDYHGVQ